MFWFGVVTTVLWLIGLGALAYFDEADLRSLPLNNIGDALAGAFAPVAFLWLFIATWMQRIELGLQRQELADTRAVMDEQRKELERAAKESNHQTTIMQQTLEASQAREVYDELSLLLYFSAKRIFDDTRGIVVQIRSSSGPSYGSGFGKLPREFAISPLDPSTVDAVFDDAREEIKTINKADSFRLYTRAGAPISVDDALNLIRSIHAIAWSVISNPEMGANRLIKARVQGLFMDELASQSEILIRKLSPAAKEVPPPQH